MTDTQQLSLKKIGVDCRLAGSKNAGIGRYISNLVKNLPEISSQTEFVYFFHDQTQALEIFKVKPSNVQFVFTPIRHYSFGEQTILPLIFLKHQLDLLHVPHFNIPILYPKKIAVTIHDLLWHQQRGPHVTTLNFFIYWFKYVCYRLVTTLAVKKAVKILVPAETIKQTVVSYYPKTKNKIFVTKEGIDQNLFLKKNQNSKFTKSLVYTGSLYPHKNIEVVLKALPNLPDFKLRIIGSRNIFVEKTKKLVAKYQVEKQVEFLGFLSDEKLLEQYSTCFALVQPSFSEGFGLTGVEALATSLPVIASDIPIFKEIYQDAAVFFNPSSSSDFIASLKKLEKMDRKELIQKGLKVASQYHWDKMAQQTFNCYQSV